jgi:hypothetical protein
MLERVMPASGTVVVAESQDVLDAVLWMDALQQAGIRATSYEQGLGGAYGGAWAGPLTRHCVVVAREDLGRARSVIAEVGGATRLSPYDDPAERRERAKFAAVMVGTALLFVIGAVLAGRLLAG